MESIDFDKTEIEILMPKEDDESNLEKLDSIKYNDKQCDVYGQKDEDGLFNSIAIERILNHADGGECDIILNLNESNGQILQEDDGILANFKFTIDDM